LRRSREDLREEILDSKTYKKFQRIVTSIRDTFDPGKIEQEIKSLHAGRLARGFGSASKVNPKNMMDASVRELANRSRLVEIRVGLVEHAVNLRKATGALKDYLLSEYQIEGLKTKTDRLAYYSRYFRQANFLYDEVDRLIDACDHFVKDIDQAGYNLKIIKECLDMIYVKERSV
jgi:hypothetical protein